MDSLDLISNTWLSKMPESKSQTCQSKCEISLTCFIDLTSKDTKTNSFHGQINLIWNPNSCIRIANENLSLPKIKLDIKFTLKDVFLRRFNPFKKFVRVGIMSHHRFHVSQYWKNFYLLMRISDWITRCCPLTRTLIAFFT